MREFKMKILSEDPTFFIQVKDGRWDAFGTPTPTNRLRAKSVGWIGINESVADGYYYLVVEREGFRPILRLRQFIVI